jgi:hypothetical protein
MESNMDQYKNEDIKKLLSEAKIPMSDFEWTNKVMDNISKEKAKLATVPLISLKVFLFFFVVVFGVGFLISSQLNTNFGLIEQFEGVFQRVSSTKIDFSIDFDLSPLVYYGLLSFFFFFGIIVLRLSRRKG